MKKLLLFIVIMISASIDGTYNCKTKVWNYKYTGKW